jgi:hypothetical protein
MYPTKNSTITDELFKLAEKLLDHSHHGQECGCDLTHYDWLFRQLKRDWDLKQLADSKLAKASSQ